MSVTARGALPLGVGLVLFAACILLAWRPPFYPGAGLDASWIMAAENAVEKHLVFGRDFVFTYGPYQEIATRMFHPRTFGLVLFYDAFQVLAIFWVALRNRSLTTLLALGAAFVFLQERGDALSALALFGVFLIALHRRDLWGFVFAALSGPLLLSKLSFGLVLLPLAALGDVERVSRRHAPLLTVTVLTSMMAAYLFSGQTLRGLGDFVGNTLQVILGYGGAMQLEGSRVELLGALGAIVAILVFATVRAVAVGRKDGANLRPIAAVLGLAWTLYVLFKISFVRQDGHTAIFHGAAPAALAMAWAFLDRPEHRSAWWNVAFGLVFGVTAFGGFYGLGYAQRPALDAKVQVGANASAAVKAFPANLRSGAGWLNGSGFSDARAKRETAMKALAGDFRATVTGAVDVVPSELSSVIASGEAYRGRPLVQSYQAYTADLQALDRAFFSGPRAPDTLIVRVDDIDSRLPTLALGPSLPVVGMRYDLVGEDTLGQVLRRRSAPRAMRTISGQSRPLRLGEWANVPGAPGKLVMARVRLKRSLSGRLIGFLFREPVVTITLRTSSGREASFRFIPGMAELGVGISPLPANWGAAVLLDPNLAALSEPVTAVKLNSTGNWAYGPATVAFDEIELTPGLAGPVSGELVAGARLVASDPKHAATFNGQEIFAHAPTILSASFPQGVHLRGIAGLHPQPPGTPPGNGVRFIVTRVSPGGPAQVVLDRVVAANAPAIPFDVTVSPGSGLQLETLDLGNTDYDWSYWGELKVAP